MCARAQTRIARAAAWLAAASAPACISPNEPASARAEAPRAEQSPRATPRVFAADSPFNSPIPPGAALDPGGDAMVAQLSRKRGAAALIYEFAIPIWDAGERTPRVPVRCTRDPEWGSCPFTAGAPVPAEARAHTGSDGALVVVDWAARESFEFWQFRREGRALVTSWGTVQSLDGSGWSSQGSSTASGASRLAGVVRVSELESGRIPHALVVSTDSACAGQFRAPAVKTDGASARGDCTPEGARLALDPAVDLERIPGISRAERVIGRALQEFGAYVIDKGGAPLGVSFELARDATSANSPGSIYAANGLAWDYFDMPKIPWHRLRVLRSWDGK